MTDDEKSIKKKIEEIKKDLEGEPVDSDSEAEERKPNPVLIILVLVSLVAIYFIFTSLAVYFGEDSSGSGYEELATTTVNPNANTLQFYIESIRPDEDCRNASFNSGRPCTKITVSIKNNFEEYIDIDYSLVNERGTKYYTLSSSYGLSNDCYKSSSSEIILEPDKKENYTFCFPLIEKSDNTVMNFYYEGNEYSFNLTDYEFFEDEDYEEGFDCEDYMLDILPYNFTVSREEENSSWGFKCVGDDGIPFSSDGVILINRFNGGYFLNGSEVGKNISYFYHEGYYAFEYFKNVTNKHGFVLGSREAEFRPIVMPKRETSRYDNETCLFEVEKMDVDVVDYEFYSCKWVTEDGDIVR